VQPIPCGCVRGVDGSGAPRWTYSANGAVASAGGAAIASENGAPIARFASRVFGSPMPPLTKRTSVTSPAPAFTAP
jgi:hypothetical protein